MKKLFNFFLAIAAVAVVAVSCQKEEKIVSQDDVITASFTVSAPGAVSTKAIGDGTTAKQLVFGVFDEQGEELSELRQFATFVDLKTTVSVRLVKGKSYQFVCWAQSPDAKCYDYSNLKAIKVSYDGANSNDEDRDAFYAYEPLEQVTSSFTKTITLKRPFAQINFGTNDIEDARKAGLDITSIESSVVVSNAATTLNTFSGQATDPVTAEITFASTAIPAQKLEDVGENKVDYDYLAMNYILVDDGSAAGNMPSTVNVKLNINNGLFTANVPTVSVQRNYRTNIVGSLLTAVGTITVEIDNRFDNDHNYYANEEIEYVFANGGEITVSEDIVIDAPLKVVPGKEVILILDGGSITNKAANTETDVIIVEAGAALTINGEGTVEAVSGNDGYAVISEGTLTVNGGTFKAGLDANGETNAVIYVRGNGKAYINGGTFPNDNASRFVLNKKDADRATTVIEVKGGKFYNFDPANNAAEGPNTNFVAEGYSSVNNGSYYAVAKNDADVVVSTADELTAAIDAAQGDVVIAFAKDIEGNVIAKQKEGANVTIDGNGHNYTGTIDIWGGARFGGAETLTMQNINFVADQAMDFISCNTAESAKRYAHNVTVKHCSFTNTGSGDVVAMRYRQCYNMVVENCSANGLHSLMWATGCTGISIDNALVENCKNGISVGTSLNVVIGNSKMELSGDYGYGVRADASVVTTMDLTHNTFTAAAPVLLRKASGDYTLNIEGNTLTTTKDYQIIVTASDYEEGKTLEAATGNVTINGDTTGLVIYK